MDDLRIERVHPSMGTLTSRQNDGKEPTYSPARLERLRSRNIERIRSMTGKASMSSKRLASAYGMTSIPRATSAVSAPCKAKAQNGTVRSLPTHIPEPPTAVNVNHIRANRTPYGARGWVGGRTYSAQALVDNWVEERRDSIYRTRINSDNPMHTRKTFETNQQAAWSDALEDYREKLRQSKMIAKQASRADYRSMQSKGEQLDFVFYSAHGPGMSATACPDRTPEYAKGGYWIGTAPVNMWETVGHVYGKEVPPSEVPEGSSKLEFQRRVMWGTPMDRTLCTMRPVPDHLMEMATTRHNKSNRFTSTWKSVAHTGYVSHVGHKAAPQLSDDLRSTRMHWTPGTSLVVGDELPMRVTAKKSWRLQIHNEAGPVMRAFNILSCRCSG